MAYARGDTGTVGLVVLGRCGLLLEVRVLGSCGLLLERWRAATSRKRLQQALCTAGTPGSRPVCPSTKAVRFVRE
jgi:hypothetical protein